MAATVKIYEKNTVSETATDKTSGTVRFRKTDSATVDLNNPLVVPSANTEYSVEKWLRMNIASGTFTQITNLRAYTDGSNGYGTGIKLWWLPLGTFTTPVIPVVTNDPPLHSSTPFVDGFSYVSGAPLNLSAINTGPYDSTGLPKDIGDYLIAVLEAEITATQGIKAAEVITFSWDEI